jgi:imidazolonepropionase-like amidohydrolase
VAIASVLTTAAHAQAANGSSRSPLVAGVTLFTNVNVVPMTGDTVIRNTTVIVRDGRIASVGGTATALPRDVRRIDGAGKYLIPGLADMHMHLYADGALPDSVAPAELGVALANGVTAVRLMAGSDRQLAWRAKVAAGDVIGPQLWVSSPAFTTRPDQNSRIITSAEDVRTATREAKTAGYDFIKITFGIVGPTYDALVDEAKRQSIRVVGHVEPEVGLHRAIAAAQELEHLDSFFEDALADSAPTRASVTQFGVYRPENWKSLDYIDDAKLTALARLVARSRAWVGPTLESFNRAFGDPLTDAELHALPDWAFIPESVRAPYVRSRERYWAQPIPRETRLRYARIRGSIVKRIADAGGAARILAGSDTPDLLMVYGFAMHRELEALVRAGLTPYQALAAGTRNGAEFLGAADSFGTIQPGRRADVVLVDGNPLADIRNTSRISGVMIGGKWLPRADIDAMLARAKRAINSGP